MFPPPLLTGTLNVRLGLTRTSMALGLVCNQTPGVLKRVVNPFPPAIMCLCSPQVVSPHPFPVPRLVVRPLPCSLSALGYESLRALPRDPSPSFSFVIGARSPHVTAVDIPSRAPLRTLRRWATVGRSSPSVCVEVAVLSGPLVAACVSPP
jgi:hypothetical protein